MEEFYDGDFSRNIKKLVSEYESQLQAGGDIYMPVADLLDVAEYYVKAGRLSEADACLTTASRLYPEDEEVKLMTAYRLRDEGLWEEAMAVVGALQDKQERDVQFFYIDAKVASMNLPAAEKMFTDLLGDFPGEDELENYVTFAEILINYGFYTRAEKWLDKMLPLIHLYKKNNEGRSFVKRYWELYGELCFQLHRYSEAEGFVNYMIDLDPYDEAAWTMLADIQFQAGRRTEAAETVEYALSINRNSARALRMKMFILSDKGDITDIGVFTDTLRQYFEQYPNDYLAYSVAGDYLSKIGSRDVSGELYSRAIRCCPADSAERLSILEKIATLQIAERAYDDALETLMCGLPLSKDLFMPYRVLMNACAGKGDIPSALKYLRSYVSTCGIEKRNIPDIIQFLVDNKCCEKAADIWRNLEKMKDDIPQSMLRWLYDALAILEHAGL